jgi:Xaa-Pro aminopeptidase
LTADWLGQRRERLREAAVDRGLDGVLVFSWRRAGVAWLTGYSPGYLTNSAALWLPVVGPPVLGVRFPFETLRASRVSGLAAQPMLEPISLLPPGVRAIGLVAGDMAVDETPPSLLMGLQGRTVRVVNLAELVDGWRGIKDEAQLEGLRKAARAGAEAFQGLGHLAGQTDFSVVAAVEEVVRRAGATRALCQIGVGDGAVVTEASGATVGQSDVVCLELTFAAYGVCMQCNTTVLPMPPSPGQLEALAACRRARSALLASIRPGVAVDFALDAGEASLRASGMADLMEYDFGHGLGADTPEHPRLVRGTSLSFEPGMAMALHVAVRKSGGPTAFVGGPIEVTDTGASELLPGASWAMES